MGASRCETGGAIAVVDSSIVVETVVCVVDAAAEALELAGDAAGCARRGGALGPVVTTETFVLTPPRRLVS